MAGGMMAEEPYVSYPITEVLRKIDEKIDRLLDRLDSKADKAAVESLAHDVRVHDEQIKTLMTAQVTAQRDQRERVVWRQWAIPVGLSITTIVVMIFQVWHP